ncbi:MAG: class I SAM-dependent methyltransferase [Prosthecobacter sp.]|nr:class I SAM-dependent methyltransferase [Prosthecobacter sp.]
MTHALTRSDRQRIASHCEGRWDYYYARAKLRSDPVYAAVARELANCDLPVLDIGCGIGLLGQYLRSSGHRAPVTGFDYDVRKISSAQFLARQSGHAGLAFSSGDARSGLPSFSGHVVILDILQFFNRQEQNALLMAAAERVSPGGKLIIRSTLRDDSWRYRVTVLGDYLAVITRWMKARPTEYPDAAQFRSVLESAGMEVRLSPLWGGTPFNNHLIIGTKPAVAH